MLYRISVTERGLTGIANIFRSRLSRLDDLLGAGTVPLRNTYRSLLPVLIPVGSLSDISIPTERSPGVGCGKSLECCRLR